MCQGSCGGCKSSIALCTWLDFERIQQISLDRWGVEDEAAYGKKCHDDRANGDYLLADVGWDFAIKQGKA